MIRINYKSALKNKRENKYSTWGYFRKTNFDEVGDYAGQRLRADKIFKPYLHNPPKFKSEDNFFAMGSCFAREIEERLSKKGLNFLSEKYSFLKNEHINPYHSSNSPHKTYLTKYSLFSIYNAFSWSVEDPLPYPKEAFHEINGLFYDPQQHLTLELVNLDKSIQRRLMIDKFISTFINADVIILTFGISEMWYDNLIQRYLNIAPDPRCAKKDPNRFEYRIPSFAEVIDTLDSLHALITKYSIKTPNIICTVSPVSLGSTFSNNDVVVGNCFSKSLNRVACEYWVTKYKNVYYFPSYEIVTWSDRNSAFQEDMRHPTREIVAEIVDYFQDNFLT